ncbi:MAG: LysM peptidoglycan-binding domain-containing protein [Streptococcus sp.]|nr:LysM peptidoglycan-binding domain-containing protein [Streptococcus sp.]
MNKKSVKWSLTGLVAASSLLSIGVINAETYTVESGDTLSAIAKEKNTTLEKLIELNKIADPNHINVGQILELDSESVDSAPAEVETAVTTTEVAPAAQDNTYQAPAAPATTYSGTLSNGNTAGETGSYAAARMAELTGVSASTWEYIIARESNGQVDAYNPSGASGLFQTMPGWGSTATVDDQIQSAYSAYNAQGLSAWGY